MRLYDWRTTASAGSFGQPQSLIDANTLVLCRIFKSGFMRTLIEVSKMIMNSSNSTTLTKTKSYSSNLRLSKRQRRKSANRIFLHSL